MSERIERSKLLFLRQYNCGQTVFSLLCDQEGLDENTAAAIACGLGSGFCCGEVCGAVSGAILSIGIKCGKASAQNNTNRTYTYQKTGEFISKFKNKHGSILCRDLFPDKKPTETDSQETALKKYQTYCSCLVEDAISIVEEMTF